MKLHLIDGCFYAFGNRSATLSGDNKGLGPANFEWCPDYQEGRYSFYTDICLGQAAGAPGKKVAWLIEPPGLNRDHYEKVWLLKDEFDYILSFRDGCYGGKWLNYPLGGSWIKLEDWGAHPKPRLMSMIASEKNHTQGHKLRHEIAQAFGQDGIDFFGTGYNPIESKVQGLRDYRYSIVVESWRGNAYFSEKLIDCLSQGTIPIYWGCPSISKYFNPGGILPFKTLQELSIILNNVVSNEDYMSRLGAIHVNLEKARQYRCAEDWIFDAYPFLFEEVD
jgi:hypothetical protein